MRWTAGDLAALQARQRGAGDCGAATVAAPVPLAPGRPVGGSTLALPYPPSVNRYWRSIGRGRVLISRDGREYRAAVVRALAGITAAMGRLAVTIAATMPDRRVRDLDNLPKAVLDALKHAGAYQDDGQIDDLRIYRAGVARGGGLLVTIGEIGGAAGAECVPAAGEG